jgi:hypothetical protein
MDLKLTEYECVEWIELPLDKIQTAMYCRVLQLVIR